MSALNEFINNFTEKYQSLEPTVTGMAPMRNSTGGRRHRLGSESDLPMILAAYQLQEIPGIVEWFAHQAQDFTSAAGFPLPFTEAIQNLTGIQADEAIQWLTANAAQLIDNGTEAELLSFLKDNPQASKYALVLGAVWGFSDESPLLTAMNALLYLRKLKREGRLQNGVWGKVNQLAKRSFGMVSNICSYTFLADAGLNMLGINLGKIVGQGLDLLHLGTELAASAEYATELASVAAELVEGVASMGTGFLASKLVKKGFEWLNSEAKQQLEKLLPLASYKKQFKTLIQKNAPPESLMPVIEMMEQNGIYQAIL